MNALRKLGFKTGWIYESIVTTRSANGVNAAPMGVWSADCREVSLLIHKTSETLENIRKEMRFAINFPEGVAVFYEAILGEESPKTQGDTLFLESCPAALEAEVTALDEAEDAVRVTARILSFRIEEKPHLINRAQYLALDSLIAYTKLSAVSEKDRAMLIERMEENLRIIRSTAPNSDFQDLGERLQD